jgi:hypothetical protein
VAAGERVDEAGHPSGVPGAGAAAGRQSRQLQPGGPSLGAVLEGGDVRRIEVEAHDVIEEGVRLVGGEAQVCGAQLEELATAAQPGQGQWRVRARGDGDGDLGRQVAEQERHGLVDVGCVDDVVVVESQHGRPGELVEIVHQADQNGLASLVAVQQRQGLRTHLGATRLDGRDEVRDEPAQLAVLGIERQPRHAR